MDYLLDSLNLSEAWRNPLLIAFWILLVWAVSRLIKTRISKSNLENEYQYRAKKLVSFAGFFVLLFVVIILYSSKLGGLSVALGVAGAGIAFALQEVIASIAGWLALLFGNFYKTGDRVQLGGIRGDVIDIGVLRTTLMETGSWVDGDLYNGRIVRIANSFVFKEPVFNYSGDFPFLWDEIKIPVRYGSDYTLAKKIIVESAQDTLAEFSSKAASTWEQMTRKYMIEDAKTEPMVTLVANDNWAEFTLRYVVDFKRRRITKDQLFTAILEAVEKSDGKVQLASATFDIVGMPEIKVNMPR